MPDPDFDLAPPFPCMGAVRAGVRAYEAWLADDAEQAKYNKEANMVQAVYSAMALADRKSSLVPDEDLHNVDVGTSNVLG